MKGGNDNDCTQPISLDDLSFSDFSCFYLKESRTSQSKDWEWGETPCMCVFVCVNGLTAFAWGGIMMDTEGEEYCPATIWALLVTGGFWSCNGRMSFIIPDFGGLEWPLSWLSKCPFIIGGKKYRLLRRVIHSSPSSQDEMNLVREESISLYWVKIWSRPLTQIWTATLHKSFLAVKWVIFERCTINTYSALPCIQEYSHFSL